MGNGYAHSLAPSRREHGMAGIVEQASDGIVRSGRFLIAAPMLIYPVLHFVYTDFVASLVPPWVPWHLFWTYFTAVTIFAAGLAIVFKKQSFPAATLLGIEILLFCAFIHLVLLFHRPDDPYATRALFGDMPSRVINAFKDFGMAGGVFIFAGTQARDSRLARWTGTIGRIIIGASLAGFGLVHFFYPVYAPGIPPISASVPFLLPGHALWDYLTGLGLLAGAMMLFFNRETRAAAASLGVGILLFELLTWVPQFLMSPAEMTGNWLKDLGIIGGILVLASSLPKRAVPVRQQ